MAGTGASSPIGPAASKAPIASLSSPVVSTPKAGGAISSIGEKFLVNSSMGTCGLSIPIPTPSTGVRGGVEPGLSLSYSSGSGNGIFGYGWSLGLGSITRRTDDGIPQYRDKDTFVVNGSEDLVPAMVQDAATGVWKSAPTFTQTVDGIKFNVRRFRPRVEGSFSSIELWIHPADTVAGDYSYWRVLSPGNNTSFYGKTAESRVVDPKDSSRIFSWLLCEARDATGNKMVMSYKQENSQGLAQQGKIPLNEQNRNDLVRSANRYIKSIKYGNRVSTLSAQAGQIQQNPWLFEVVFDYGEHSLDDPRPSDSGSWVLRNDPFSTFRAGFEIRTYRLCQRILVFHHFPEKAGDLDDCLVKSVDLTYSSGIQASGLSQRGQARGTFLEKVAILSYKRRNTGTGYLKKAMPPISLAYTKPTVNPDIHSIEIEGMQDYAMPDNSTSFTFADLYGDGVPGILI